MDLNRNPWIYRLAALAGLTLLFWSCGESETAQPSLSFLHKKAKTLHDDPVREALILVDAKGLPDKDKVCISFSGNGGPNCKVKYRYVRWVATKSDANLDIPTPVPTPAPTPPGHPCPSKFADVVCSGGQCISRDLTPEHIGCWYKYKACVNGNCGPDPTIMIDP